MVFYRECPNCHKPKKWKFTISLFILLTILGFIPGFIYAINKILDLRCEKCGFTTQNVHLNNVHGASSTNAFGDCRTDKMKNSNASLKEKWQNASDGNKKC